AEGVTAAQLDVPDGLRQVIGQRVARLSAPAQRTLRFAAVAGPTFSFVLLERVLGEQSVVLDALDEAVAAGLLTEAGQDQYAFAHALVRQTIYEQLGAARRMRLHRQLGETLEALGDTDAHVEALAHHFAQAALDGQTDKAVDYALAAGTSAIARFGYDEAAAHYERGLQALEHAAQPPEQRRGRPLAAYEQRRCELLLGLGAAYWGAGELDKAREAHKQAAARATPVRAAIRAHRRMRGAGEPDQAGRLDGQAAELGDATTLARAALGFCGPHRFEVAPAATQPVADLLQRALAALDETDSALRAQLMGRLAAALAYTGVEGGTSVLAHQALEMARRVGDKAALADVLASTHWALRGPDSLEESLAMAAELASVAEDLDDGQLRALAHMFRLVLLLSLADIEAVERELAALQQLGETRTDRYLTWLVRVLRASHALLQGRLEDAESLARDAFDHRYGGHDETATRIFTVQMLLVRIAQGRLEEFVDIVKGSASQYPQNVSWRCALALVHLRLGRTQQVRQELEALARAGFTDLPRDESWLTNLWTLSAIVAVLGDAPRAQLLYELLLPYADRCVVSGALMCMGSASHPLGLLATTLSRYDDAERHFEQAIKMNTQIRSPFWTAHTQHDYARMVLLRSRVGDRDRALQLLAQALATAEQLGLKALADKVESLKLTAEAAELSLTLPRFA
ncbi:MAG: hypothetical protein QOJ29_1874, partial [Thermoleophilaceae bacterium]|nr:hypothetical protein [Thermoleophilaceae bacterium]